MRIYIKRCHQNPNVCCASLQRKSSSAVAAAEAFCGGDTFRSSNKPTIPIMAQSISQAKRALAFALNRRGYAVASDVSSFTSAARGGMSGIEKGVAKNGSGPSGASSAWVPDPVTGYYRPINHREEIDPVELRKMLLNHKGKSS